MAYKQKSNGLPFKQMGSTMAKQTYTTPEMNEEKNNAEMELNRSKASGTSTKEQQDRYDKAAAGFIQKNTEDNDRRKAEGKSVFPQKVGVNTTNSKVITKDNEITIAANKKAAEIGKYGNKAKKTGDYTPAELALIRNPAYQKALSLALDKVMKDNPDTTGE